MRFALVLPARRCFPFMAGLILIMVILCNPGVSASASRKAVTAIRVTAKNAERFGLASGGIVCYAKPKRAKLIPGRFVIKRKSKAKRSKRERYFVKYQELAQQKLRKLKKKRLSKAQLKRRAANLRSNHAAQKALCNSGALAAYIFSAPGAANSGGSGGVSAGPRVWGDLRLRWFPSDKAQGYYILAETLSGQLLRKEQAQVSGCTHRAREGFTSGICQTEVKTGSLRSPYRIRVSAFNRSGESIATGPTL